MVWWIWLILIIIGGLITFKIIKSVLKTFFIVSFILLIVSGILIFFMVKDMNDFKENFPSAKKLFLLEDNGVIVGATTINEFDFGPEKSPEGYDKDSLTILNTQYNPEDLLDVQGDHYIVFVLKKELFVHGLPDPLTPSEDESYDKATFLNALFSDTPSDLMVGEYEEDQRELARAELLKSYSEEDLRALLMMMGFSMITEEHGTLYVVKELKEEKLIIYPEYSVFSVVKKTPMFILDRLVKDDALIGNS